MGPTGALRTRPDPRPLTRFDDHEAPAPSTPALLRRPSDEQKRWRKERKKRRRRRRMY